MNKKILYVYTSLVPIVGVKRSLLVDTQKRNHFFIPNALAKIIITYKFKINTEKLLKKHINSQEILKEYFEFLLENNLGIYLNTSELKSFPELALTFEVPNEITNVIIDFSLEIQTRMNEIALQLDSLNVQAVHGRFYNKIKYYELTQFLKPFLNSSIRNIILDLQYDQEILNMIRQIIKDNQKISVVTFYNSPKEEFNFYKDFNNGNIIFTKQTLKNCTNCGVTNPALFSKEIDHITESHNHNTCLNKKISIDVSGNIKNCPSMKKSYGNIKKTSLKDVVDNPTFKKLWHVKKDDISVCKDCEFRHICADCRAYLEDPKDIYSKPLKCGYNPYTCEWEKWSSNPLKKAAIEHYSLNKSL